MAQIGFIRAGKSYVIADPIRVGDLHNAGEFFEMFLIQCTGRAETQAEPVDEQREFFCERGKLFFTAMKEMFSGDF